MNKNIFLIDEGCVYSYDDLLAHLSLNNYYYPIIKTNSLYDFFINMIKAIISNNSLILLDSDLTNNEINDIDKININRPICINNYSIDTFSQLIDDFKNSSSEISIFTSGTTGKPKKVVHNYSNLKRNVREADKYKDKIWAYAYNPTHMAGLQVFLQAFTNKNTLVNVFNKSREYIYNHIRNYNITHISATPTFYRLLLPIEKQYSSVERVTFGGEKSNQILYNSMSEIFPNAKINNIYASTEAGSLFVSNGESFQIPSKIKDKIIIKNNEILLHKSLLGNSEDFIFEDDYYKTGDLIEWHNEETGLFKFNNRKNEIINVGGYKVNPTEVEDAILKIMGIQQVKVYGKKNSVLGNILCADIQLSVNYKNSITEKYIRQNLIQFLQNFKIPRIIKFVDSFQLTRTGKLKRV